MPLKLPWRKTAPEKPLSIAERKSRAFGSPLVRGEDKRLKGFKIGAATLSAAMLLGAAAGVNKLHEYRETQRAVAAQNAEKLQRSEIARKLINAGVKDSNVWVEAYKTNQALREKYPGLPEFTPDEYAELERIANASHMDKRNYGPAHINQLRQVLKGMHTSATTPEDYKAERESLGRALSAATAYGDNWVNIPMVSTTTYLMENNHKPVVRRVMGKLRSYDMFGMGPFYVLSKEEAKK
jgi:hypothetical protein